MILNLDSLNYPKNKKNKINLSIILYYDVQVWIHFQIYFCLSFITVIWEKYYKGKNIVLSKNYLCLVTINKFKRSMALIYLLVTVKILDYESMEYTFLFRSIVIAPFNLI